MNLQEAKQQVEKALTQAFDEGRFRTFSMNLLKDLGEPSTTVISGAQIPEHFKPHIKSYTRIGTYKNPQNEVLDVIAVKLLKPEKLDRARTMQRNFLAYYMKIREKDAIIAAFHTENHPDWRFSFCRLEYKAELTEKGIKPKEELTPARRYSFLVGKNEASHTAQTQLVSLLLCEEPPSLDQIENSFSLEKVSDEFFAGYKHLLIRIKEFLAIVLEKNRDVREDFKAKDVSPVDFVKKLLGQIIFLYFLQKKGWFGVPRNSVWGTGSKDFMRRIFEKKIIPYDNFFNDILEPLFYETLAKERDADFCSRFNCKIPFLNGGLFDPIRSYDWVHTDILLPNELFSNSESAKTGDIGTGVLDVLDRFNFTVNESEPLEKEVAIDPEFLGKIFEKLNAINDKNFSKFQEAEKSGKDSDIKEFNKKNGVYYTPPEVVHYMCKQSLCYYLGNSLGDHCPKDDIERFVYLSEQLADFEANPTQKHEDKRLPESIRNNAGLIDKALEDLAVCDPAIGSGAFPVGMLTEIVRLRSVLNIPLGLERSRYSLKRKTIEHSLYGVDIDAGAVEIAKLRLWLSLVVDEDDIRKIQPLPNLDYKIMQGNSLLDRFKGARLFDDSSLNLIDIDIDAERDSIKKRISKIQSEALSLHGSGKLTAVKRYELEQQIKCEQKTLATFNKEKGRQDAGDELIDQFKESRNRLLELWKKHDEFFPMQSGKRKSELRNEIETLIWDFMEASLHEENRTEELKHLQKLRYASAKPFFLWKLHFSEVFQKRKGFDIVIGNPPYVRADVDDPAYTKMRQEILDCGFYDTLWEKWDLFIPFIERGYKYLRPEGIISYIVSDAFCHSKYAQKPQNWFLKNSRILRLDFLGKLQIFEAGVRNVTFFFQRDEGESNKPERLVHEEKFGNVRLLSTNEQKNLTCRSFFPEDQEKKNFTGPSILLENICYITKGMVVHANEKVAKGSFKMDDLVSEKQDTLHPKPFVEGKDLGRWLPVKNNWLEWGTDRAPSLFSRPTFPEMYEVEEKILVQRSPGPDPKACYDNIFLHFTESSVGFIPWHFLCGVRNNSLKKAARYKDDKPPRSDLPKREVLEETSSNFSVKYLLAVMNSSVARDFLRANRRSNIHLYPDDWKKLPIPEVTAEQQAPIIVLVDKILSTLNADHNASVSDLEKEIDRLVSDLYGISAVSSDVNSTAENNTSFGQKATALVVRRDLKEYLRTECLPKIGEKYKYFNIESVRKYLKENSHKVADNLLKLYMSELMGGLFIQDAGKGWYTFIQEPFIMEPRPTEDLEKLLVEEYPLLDFACWSTEHIKSHMHHMLSKFISFVYVERHDMASIFEKLQDAGYSAYLNPTPAEAKKSFTVREKTVVIRPSISRQPVLNKLATIEKLLVDLYIESKELPIMDTGEYLRMLENLICSQRVSISKLIKYAERRNVNIKELINQGEHTIATF